MQIVKGKKFVPGSNLFFFASQMGLGQQGGGNTQTNVGASHSMQEKRSVATGDQGQVVAAWRMSGTAYQSGVWRTQMKKQGRLTLQALFCL